jgi:N-acetylmuramoyl-L-alanine amidase
MRSAIQVGGRLVECEVPVITTDDTSFPVRNNRAHTRFVVCHWTGSENPVRQVVENMRSASKSVHFIVTANGAVYQCGNANWRLAHAAAGDGNRYGIGIEFINRGHALELWDHGTEREMVTERVQGQELTYGLMTTEQKRVAVALCGTLCAAYELPFQVPVDARTGAVVPRLLPEGFRGRFRGVLGHFHLDPGKVDPGLDLLEHLKAHGGFDVG